MATSRNKNRNQSRELLTRPVPTNLETTMAKDDVNWDKMFDNTQESQYGHGHRRGKKREDPGHDIIEVEVLKITDAGILVRGAKLAPDPFGMADANQEEWFPLSQVHGRSELGSDSKIGDVGMLVITEWLATKKGLI